MKKIFDRIRFVLLALILAMLFWDACKGYSWWACWWAFMLFPYKPEIRELGIDV